jgi:hypothetical protein
MESDNVPDELRGTTTHETSDHNKQTSDYGMTSAGRS